MKKIIAVLMVLSVVLAFAGCKSKEYQDTVVTIPVTDENGETVTDKDGKVVTEISTEAQISTKGSDSKDSTKQSSAAAANGSSETTKQNSGGNATENKNNSNNSGNSNNNNSNNGGSGNTEKPTVQTTTKPTEAPTKSKKRDIHLVVHFPTYTPSEAEMVVKYRVDGGKFEELAKDKVQIGEAFTKEYDLKKVKGAVEFIITVGDIDVTNNRFTVESSDKDQTHEITLVTGIEVVEGGWD